ncbi:unnamed protein product [Arabis nemorensis]|uniref:Uncharacterized protein n=1 Tax=Arabis nemorensis TaxID=586526 RepID=A0A565CTR2_9BRAS|nr:unnamed protein product [Arabis nemorensis]
MRDGGGKRNDGGEVARGGDEQLISGWRSQAGEDPLSKANTTVNLPWLFELEELF